MFGMYLDISLSLISQLIKEKPRLNGGETASRFSFISTRQCAFYSAFQNLIGKLVTFHNTYINTRSATPPYSPDLAYTDFPLFRSQEHFKSCKNIQKQRNWKRSFKKNTQITLNVEWKMCLSVGLQWLKIKMNAHFLFNKFNLHLFYPFL